MSHKGLQKIPLALHTNGIHSSFRNNKKGKKNIAFKEFHTDHHRD